LFSGWQRRPLANETELTTPLAPAVFATAPVEAPRRVVVLCGAPGAGKGSQTPRLSALLGVPSLAAGDMLRAAVEAGTEVGKQAKEKMDKGELVSNELVIGVIRERIQAPDCSKGFILDGFPRSMEQANALDEMLNAQGEQVSACIELNVPDEVLEERICGRWMHKASGRSYHVKFAPPASYTGGNPSAENMFDDETGDALYQRSDDTKEALKTRLVTYHSQTEPVMAHYNGVEGCASTRVKGDQEMSGVWKDLSECFAQPIKPTNPLLLRALRGEDHERPPAWIMRQAGRYMKSYQELVKEHPTFRERSETVELAVEISLQPYRAFKPDGVILFSDILTPLPGMGVNFDILEKEGPVIAEPVRTMEDVQKVRKLDPAVSMPFVGETLRILRSKVDDETTVLGFVGAPFTLATYLVEGKSSRDYRTIKTMMAKDPEVLKALLSSIADSIAEYVRYQADNGAHVVQIFDSWAANLTPKDFEEFALPYIKQIVAAVKETHPDLPLTLFIFGAGGLLERMATFGGDCLGIDWTVDMVDARNRIGPDLAVQGNVDPIVLFTDKETIYAAVDDVVRRAGGPGAKHVMNLGHGVLQQTPEENVAHFFDACRTVHTRVKDSDVTTPAVFFVCPEPEADREDRG
jgi:uroporphyrinogen decarboxylase